MIKNRLLPIQFLFRAFLTVILMLSQSLGAFDTKTQYPFEFHDIQGVHRFDQAPVRVVVLTWALVESVIELGIEPIAIADINGYNEWVSRPELPPTVVDLGTRQEPNIERLVALKPDLILMADLQLALIDEIKNIAPVIAVRAFDEEHNNLTTARALFLQLGRLFDRQAKAQQKLAAVDLKLVELRQKLDRHFQGKLPKVTTVRFNNPSVVWVYGKNSMPEYALEQLGLEPAWKLPATQWGVVQRRVRDLVKIEQGVLLHFEPFKDAQRLFNSRLWKAMPFVQNHAVAAIPPTWTYGGPISIQYLAEAMTDALLKLNHPANALTHK